jgi:sugar phosphate isomerase/epimerase
VPNHHHGWRSLHPPALVISRREFAATLSRAALGAALTGCGTQQPSGDARTRAGGTAKLDRIGIQLYTVRGLMERDPNATLGALAAIGYREVEFAGLYGRSATDFRRMLDSHNLTAPAGHVSIQDIRTALSRLLDDAATLGWRWIVCPWIDERERTLPGYRRVAADLNRAGESARAVGLRMGYHNHEFEFARLADGTVPYDILLEELDPQLVDMELDLYWIVHGGGDPLAYFQRQPGRFPLLHVKDRTRSGTMVDVGDGAIDFGRIFASAATAGTRHYFVEHDQPEAPLDFARNSFVYLSRLRY